MKELIDLIALPSLSTSYYTAVLSYHRPFVMNRTDKCVYYRWMDGWMDGLIDRFRDFILLV